ncbi:HPr family phosphocarrier protein [Bacillaceae bacterium SIJ1]|uniref:HPr family phosphocarrier protein n=1 Tax=Litoribacterium kuwaitense TaxID=1398745 RepID=UPI0013EDDCC5|nr:HPr family phosphocarrier protein [Litoribacterium kuwaitense]NGP44301.1 HPr family phosphocarrier protein [Litoribacterium kuwaitense]
MEEVQKEIQCKRTLDQATTIAFCQLAGQYLSDVKIRRGSFTVDAKSMMGLMAIPIKDGVSLTIEASGTDAEEAVSAIEEFLGQPAASNV